MRDKSGKFIKGCNINQGRNPSIEQREKQSDSMKGRILTEDHKAKIKKSMANSSKKIGKPKGTPAWNSGMRKANGDHLSYGIPCSDEKRKKISIANTGHVTAEKTKRKLSLIVKEWWKNPENARKALVFNSPNKQEQKLTAILESMYPGEWKFVGNGQVIIDGKCPDFININGQKKIIELYGERWHQNHDPQDRINFFKPFGYDTLVIWVRELQNLRRVKTTIAAFCEGREKGEVMASIGGRLAE
jgi:hypothetical protein